MEQNLFHEEGTINNDNDIDQRNGILQNKVWIKLKQCAIKKMQINLKLLTWQSRILKMMIEQYKYGLYLSMFLLKRRADVIESEKLVQTI